MTICAKIYLHPKKISGRLFSMISFVCSRAEPIYSEEFLIRCHLRSLSGHLRVRAWSCRSELPWDCTRLFHRNVLWCPGSRFTLSESKYPSSNDASTPDSRTPIILCLQLSLRNGGKGTPEMRLPLLFVSSAIIPIGLLYAFRNPPPFQYPH